MNVEAKTEVLVLAPFSISCSSFSYHVMFFYWYCMGTAAIFSPLPFQHPSAPFSAPRNIQFQDQQCAIITLIRLFRCCYLYRFHLFMTYILLGFSFLCMCFPFSGLLRRPVGNKNHLTFSFETVKLHTSWNFVYRTFRVFLLTVNVVHIVPILIRLSKQKWLIYVNVERFHARKYRDESYYLFNDGHVDNEDWGDMKSR